MYTRRHSSSNIGSGRSGRGGSGGSSIVIAITTIAVAAVVVQVAAIVGVVVIAAAVAGIALFQTDVCFQASRPVLTVGTVLCGKGIGRVREFHFEGEELVDDAVCLHTHSDNVASSHGSEGGCFDCVGVCG